ncbi:JM136 [macacine gammaherpesvirus 11]|uniref:JM136 n=2 Tax=macacine gammaherpesvirus 11 TaxID=2560570 RepID=G9JMW4_9GAMA|nr:JM136 [Macaca fuscata rhadinovirus]AAT00113.1 JM136 [Macaca fuscata rhadinovirus]AEW87661.1 JM136 [Macaca fuscata rhadinovirus]AEW87831.1 JM136 [Macaca fuscata rhadinovirus]
MGSTTRDMLNRPLNVRLLRRALNGLPHGTVGASSRSEASSPASEGPRPRSSRLAPKRLEMDGTFSCIATQPAPFHFFRKTGKSSACCGEHVTRGNRWRQLRVLHTKQHALGNDTTRYLDHAPLGTAVKLRPSLSA